MYISTFVGLGECILQSIILGLVVLVQKLYASTLPAVVNDLGNSLILSL